MKTEKILNDRGELKKIKIEIKEYICKIIKEHNENPKHSEPHNEKLQVSDDAIIIFFNKKNLQQPKLDLKFH